MDKNLRYYRTTQKAPSVFSEEALLFDIVFSALYFLNFLRIIQALCPPNPKVLDRAAFTSLF